MPGPNSTITKQGVRNLNSIGPQRKNGAKPVLPGDQQHETVTFCHHHPVDVFDKTHPFPKIGEKCGKCGLPLKGKLGDIVR